MSYAITSLIFFALAFAIGLQQSKIPFLQSMGHRSDDENTPINAFDLSDPFIIPVIEQGKSKSYIVATVSLEVQGQGISDFENAILRNDFLRFFNRHEFRMKAIHDTYGTMKDEIISDQLREIGQVTLGKRLTAVKISGLSL